MLNVLESKPNETHLYYQYRSIPALEEYFNIIYSLINTLYFKDLNAAYVDMNPYTARTEYLSFYVLNILGLYKPLGAASLNVFYDIEEKYDQTPSITYDDAQEYDGTIGLNEFKLYMSFILNYSMPIFNIHTLVKLCSLFCKFSNLRDVTIESTLNGVTIRIPQTQFSTEFLKLLRVYYNNMGLPYGINFEVLYNNTNESI